MEARLTRRGFLKLAAAAPVAAASARVMSAREELVARKPNILFLMTDQHRADCFGFDGNRVVKTPNFDRIAHEGVRFVHAYSSTPTCTPARAAILTGLSPWHHGMIGYGRVAERYELELPQAMKQAGYYTFAVGKLHYHPQRNYHGFDGALIDESGRAESPGFVSDYRKWFKDTAPSLDPDATGIDWNDYRSGKYTLPEELHPTRWTGDRALEFIEGYDRHKPFFLKVSFARPHSPYDPPARFMDMFREGDMPAPHVGGWASRYASGDPSNYASWHGDFGVDQVRKSRRGYYGSVSFIDEQVGRILRALEAKGLLDDTLILYTADHGDMIADHHLWRKSYAYEASARIPMLLRWPKSFGNSDRRGSLATPPVELRDLLPTFLDAAGARVPEQLDGDSLLKLVRGEAEGWRKHIDLEHSVCYAEENHWNALTDGRWKYIYHAFDGHEQLFDLEEDPAELTDLASDTGYQRTLAYWRREMVKHLSERGDGWVNHGELVIRPEGMLYSPHYPGGA